MVCVGDLKHRISFVKRVEGRFSSNSLVKDWTFKEQFKAWSKIKSTSGITFVSGVAVNDGSTDIFTVRYNNNISSELFIHYKGLRFKILSVKNIDRDDLYMALSCQELGSIDLKGSQK